MTLEAVGSGPPDDHALLDLLDALGAHAGVITGSPEVAGDLGRYGAMFTVGAAAGPEDALTLARAIFDTARAAAALPAWPIVHAELTTIAEHHRLVAG